MSRDIRPNNQRPRLRGSIEGASVRIAYWVEVAPDDFQLTVDRAAATHGLIDLTGAGDWKIVPLELTDGSVRLRRIGADTYRGF